MSNEAILLRIESLLVEIRNTLKESFEHTKEVQKAIKDGKFTMGMDEETLKMFEYIKQDEEKKKEDA